MRDIQTYVFSFRYIALLFVVTYFIMVLFGKSFKIRISSRFSVFVIIAILFGSYIFFKIQQYQVRNSLRSILSVVDYSKSIDERLSNCNRPDSVIFELTQQKNCLDTLKEKNYIISKVIGKSKTIDTLISQMQNYLDNQLYRAQNVNIKSSERFTPTEYKSTSDIRSIRPEGLGSAYINAGLLIDEISSFRNNNTLLVRIVQTEKDTVLYERTYVPQGGINAFVLPNFFNSDKVELQLGYVNKQEQKTYHYIVERPYERK